MDIALLLKQMVDENASDLHLKVPNPPVLRINGVLVVQEKLGPLNAGDMQSILEQVTSPEQRNVFNNERELDFAYSITGLARFRVNVLLQRGTLSLAFRLVPFKIPSIEDLGLPDISKKLIMMPRGLILITGPTGSGKSTTLAAMMSYLNANTRRTVITIEDPIEFLYMDDKCFIAQRDLWNDTHSFSNALKHALRHDPEVLVIGELRDLDTIGTAIMAAETGHLVLGTLHTIDAAQTVDRIVDIFPHEQQRQIRMQLAQVLEAVLSQVLLPCTGGGRVAAFEVLIATPAIRKLIREEKIMEIAGNMELSGQEGMQTMDQALVKLVKKNLVTLENAQAKSSNQVRFNKFLQYSREEE
jgi:twitching motility protein PilT